MRAHLSRSRGRCLSNSRTRSVCPPEYLRRFTHPPSRSHAYYDRSGCGRCSSPSACRRCTRRHAVTRQRALAVADKCVGGPGAGGTWALDDQRNRRRTGAANGAGDYAPLTHDIAGMSRQLVPSHQDPADRFLAATALVMGLTLVTADEQLLQLTEYAVLADT